MTREVSRPPTLESAVATFIGGFTYTRSFTHPYVAETVGGLWVMRDGPRKRPAYRNEEWVVRGQPAADVDRTVRANARGRFVVCDIVAAGESAEDRRDAFKAMGYRLGTTEPLFAHDLKTVPRPSSPAVVERVRSAELAAAVNASARSRQVLPEHLSADSRQRQYVALVDGTPVGRVRSITVGHSTWCSNMFVDPAHRRRGIGRALLARMLADDRRHGATAAVLLASHAGAKLYPVVGYRQIGTLLLFTPKRR